MTSHWDAVTLGDVCDFSRGLTYKKKDEVPTSSTVVLRANNIDLESGTLNFDDLRFISDEVNIPDDKRVVTGALLICTASGSKKHLGKVALVGVDCGYAFGGFMGLLRPKPGIHPEFLYWVMRSQLYKDFIDQLSDGVNINNLNLTQLAEFRFRLPPLSEQKRIAATLDDALGRIDAALANIQNALANTRALFDSYLDSFHSEPNPNWASSTIGEVVRFIDYRGRTPPKSDRGLRLITAKNVRPGYLNREPQEFVDQAIYADWMRRGIPQYGDVLFTTEAPLANVAQLDTDERVVFAQRIIVMQPMTGVLDPTFLKYMLMSAAMQNTFRAEATGATAKGIKASRLKRVTVSFPSISQQVSIASRLTQLETATHDLEAVFRRKLAAFADLKQSIFRKAFSGEPTTEMATESTAA